jgi:hypothetical protein
MIYFLIYIFTGLVISFWLYESSSPLDLNSLTSISKYVEMTLFWLPYIAIELAKEIARAIKL